VALQLLPLPDIMPQDFEQFLKEVFGESWAKLSQFQADKVSKITSRLQEIARDAVKDEFTKLHSEIADLRARVAKLEAERVEAVSEQV
jgi:hypothetical protein